MRTGNHLIFLFYLATIIMNVYFKCFQVCSVVCLFFTWPCRGTLCNLCPLQTILSWVFLHREPFDIYFLRSHDYYECIFQNVFRSVHLFFFLRGHVETLCVIYVHFKPFCLGSFCTGNHLIFIFYVATIIMNVYFKMFSGLFTCFSFYVATTLRN